MMKYILAIISFIALSNGQEIPPVIVPVVVPGIPEPEICNFVQQVIQEGCNNEAVDCELYVEGSKLLKKHCGIDVEIPESCVDEVPPSEDVPQDGDEVIQSSTEVNPLDIGAAINARALLHNQIQQKRNGKKHNRSHGKKNHKAARTHHKGKKHE